MTTLIFALLIFLSLLEWVIFLDVILSWTRLIGINFHPKFIKDITLPLYEGVRKFLPTSFGNIDFAPIIVFLAIEILSKLLLAIDPSVTSYLAR